MDINHSIKSGIVHNKQRHQCKKCTYRLTVKTKNAKITNNDIKKLALQMYLEGVVFRNIARILKFSHVAAYKRIKSYGKNTKELAQQKSNNINTIK